MCYGCYEDAGCPKIKSQKTVKAASLISAVYDCEYGGVGGYGHIVFDDWNIGDSNIDSCIEEASEGKYFDGEEEIKVASLEALVFFKTLTEEERYSALAIQDGFLK